MIRVWRDTPKRGETDAQWCYTVSRNGHIVASGIDFLDEESAIEAAKKVDAARK